MSMHRRQFLATAAAATLATGASTALARTIRPTAPWQMKLSTSSLHYRSLSLQEACERIGKLGFAGIDVWSHFEWAGPLCEHLEEGVQKMGVEGFAKLLGQHQLALFSASCYSVSLPPFLPALGEMGGCVVVRGSGSVTVPGRDPTLAELKQQMRAFLDSLAPELEAAQKHNCVLAIENHSGDSLLNKLDSLKVFVEMNRHPNLGIALAPYHVQFNQQSVEEAIRVAGDQLKFFYAWQHGEGTQQLPGIGPTDVRPWLRALAEVNYQGYVNPFMHHEPEPDAMDQALAKSRDYLRASYAELFAQ